MIVAAVVDGRPVAHFVVMAVRFVGWMRTVSVGFGMEVGSLLLMSLLLLGCLVRFVRLRRPRRGARRWFAGRRIARPCLRCRVRGGYSIISL